MNGRPCGKCISGCAQSLASISPLGGTHMQQRASSESSSTSHCHLMYLLPCVPGASRPLPKLHAPTHAARVDLFFATQARYLDKRSACAPSALYQDVKCKREGCEMTNALNCRASSCFSWHLHPASGLWRCCWDGHWHYSRQQQQQAITCSLNTTRVCLVAAVRCHKPVCLLAAACPFLHMHRQICRHAARIYLTWPLKLSCTHHSHTEQPRTNTLSALKNGTQPAVPCLAKLMAPAQRQASCRWGMLTTGPAAAATAPDSPCDTCGSTAALKPACNQTIACTI